MNPWDVRPYATWTFDVPNFSGKKLLGGAAYDPATQTLYLAQIEGEPRSQDGWDMPLIQVFQMTLN